MTRETKIGLLVGLAFIVVFAMLLSHSGTVPPPGDGIQMARARTEAPPPAPDAAERVTSPAVPVVPPPAATTPISPAPAPSPAQTDAAAPTELTELPSPPDLNTPGAPAATNGNSTDVATSEPPSNPLASNDSPSPLITRTAPPLPAQVPVPAPTPRDTTPTLTMSGGPSEDAAPTPTTTVPTPTLSTPTTTPPTHAAGAPKEYIVKKGETLVQIAKAMYQSASPKIMDFLMKSNKDRIKNKHFLVEGQKLMIPELPADMFEPVTNINVGQSSARLAGLRDRVNSIGTGGADSPRHAPEIRLESARKPDSESARPSKEVRTYEVKANQTFSSIARDELGSERYWKEIAKLNKGVDPAKMRPGTKIRIPARKSAPELGSTGRSAA